MNQLIGMIISAMSVGLVMNESLDAFQNDSGFIAGTFTQIKSLHEIRDYNHKQYAIVTHSNSEDFRTPYHLTFEDIEQLETMFLNINSYDTGLKLNDVKENSASL